MPLVLPRDLTVNQTAVWLDQQLFTGKPVCNTAAAVSIRGKLRFDLFEAALRETVAENPGLRLPPWTGTIQFDLPVLDFRSEKDPSAAARQWMQTELNRVIPLDGAALFRFALLRIGDEHTLWFQKFHHIIMDATGRRVLSERTAARYRVLRFGESLSVVDAATPRELLEAERLYMASEQREADRKYWLGECAKWPESFLDVDWQNSERAKSGCHARVDFELKRADFKRLEAAAKKLGSSTFRTIIALTYVAFARIYNRYDLVLGLELGNRPDARSKQTLGYLARPLPMILSLDPNTTIADAVRQVEEIRARTYPHRHFPVGEVASELGITRKRTYGLYDIIVNYLPEVFDFKFEEFPVELHNVSYSFAAPWLITVADTSPTQDLRVTIDTDPGLISAETAAQLASCVEILLLHGLENPACPLALLPIMPEEKKAEVLSLAAGKSAPLPDQETLASLCAAQAERTPDAIALICGEQQLSYAALHEQAGRMARRLAARGVKPGVVVGIALPRTPSLVAAVLAVHKAGGTYLALDPSYPSERIRYIVADAAAPVIITNEKLAPVFADSGAKLLLDSDTGDAMTERLEFVPARPDDLAYVLYTSGSTGRPKAVGIEHRHLINLISWGRSVVSDVELRGMLFSTSLNFDLSAFEMFVPLAFGGCIVLVETVLSLQSAPHRDKVRLVNTGPSLFEALLRADGLPSGVTSVILAGEKLPGYLAASIFNAAPKIRLLNCYGPTETTVYSTWSQVDPKSRLEPNIGRPIWNTCVYILDSGRALLPRGVAGELYIGGAGVARGYLGRPELTAERFIANPFGPGQLYRTGDRVRWLPDGDIEFLGRADDQMKINGIRVEPGEIEAALLALPGISAAAVALREDSAGARRLVAYLVAATGAARTTDPVRAALEKQLPRNMVPTYFVWLAAMPLTPNGKLDRKALPKPAREDVSAPVDHLPQTGLERELAAIWEDLLQVSPIGVQTDFYDLGGDSLALVSLFASIEARFGRHLTVDVLSGGLTIASLAQVLAEDEAKAENMDPVVALQPLGNLPPFFCVYGVGGDVLHLHRLAVHMGTDRPFLGLRQTRENQLTDTVADMAARCIAAMLRHQPSGPYYLGGHSFGAAVAFEMAQQLLRQGHEVGLFAVIDQRRPGWRLTARNVLPALPRILPTLPGRISKELASVPRRERFRELIRVLMTWAKAAFGIQPKAVALFHFRPDETEKVAIYDSNLRAARSYRPQKLPAPITLVRAEVQPLSNLALDTTLGWRDLTTEGARVHVVPGTHWTVVKEPNVRHLAEALCAELDEAQGVRRPGRPPQSAGVPAPTLSPAEETSKAREMA